MFFFYSKNYVGVFLCVVNDNILGGERRTMKEGAGDECLSSHYNVMNYSLFAVYCQYII